MKISPKESTKHSEKNGQMYHRKITKIFEIFENTRTQVCKIVQSAQKNKIQMYKLNIDTLDCF